MKYPEGWAQQGTAGRVTFRDKNNIVRVVVSASAGPTAASVRTDLRRLAGAHVQSGPQRLTINGAPAFKVVYTTQSAPNAVTGKRVELVDVSAGAVARFAITPFAKGNEGRRPPQGTTPGFDPMEEQDLSNGER